MPPAQTEATEFALVRYVFCVVQDVQTAYDRSAAAKLLQALIDSQRSLLDGTADSAWKLADLLCRGTEEQKREGFALFGKFADTGHVKSIKSMANCFSTGCGVTQDEKGAAHCNRQLIELEFAQRESRALAMRLQLPAPPDTVVKRTPTERSQPVPATANDDFDIALVLLSGVEEEKKEAFRRLCKLGSAGHAKSTYMVGWCHENGCGTIKDASKAFACFRDASKLDDPQAQFALGVCYRFGRGTDPDEKKAVECYMQAAHKGNAAARYNLACCLREGRGIAKDEGRAFEWFCMAANQGDVDAECAVADCYQRGIGCEKDNGRAAHWFLQAAKKGHALAQCNLALCLRDGTGVEKNAEFAFAWFEQAAQGGNATAQLELARCYLNGWGTEKQTDKAIAWLTKAEANGHKVAVLERIFLRAEATERVLLDRWKWTAQRPTNVSKTRVVGPFHPMTYSTFGQAVHCQLWHIDKLVDVAVKVPKDDRISEGWLNEMLALTVLPPHENVLKLHGVCSEFECTDAKGVKLKPPLSFVTQFAEQGSIADFFSHKENEGSVKFLLPWALDIARGLAHMHEHGCVHRDLAARNVFIDKEHRAIIGDLGLARPLDEAKGLFKSEHKTHHYPAEVAPQVLQAEEYSPASDVFSFGLTLFEIATECKFDEAFAFSRSSLSAQAAKIQLLAANGYPDLVRKLPATLPASMVKLMLRCLDFESKDRPTAAALVGELSMMLPVPPTKPLVDSHGFQSRIRKPASVKADQCRRRVRRQPFRERTFIERPVYFFSHFSSTDDPVLMSARSLSEAKRKPQPSPLPLLPLHRFLCHLVHLTVFPHTPLSPHFPLPPRPCLPQRLPRYPPCRPQIQMVSRLFALAAVSLSHSSKALTSPDQSF